MIINVQAKTRASRNHVEKISDTIYKVYTTAVPEKGQANQKIIEILAKHFKKPKSNISLKSGSKATEKLFEIN